MVRSALLLGVVGLAAGSCAREAPLPQQVSLLAAAVDLEEGVEVERSQMEEVKVSPSLATANALGPEALQQTAGKRLRISLRKGNLLLASYFEAAGAPTPAPAPDLAPDTPVSSTVMRKGRAVTLSVSGAEGLRPGDHVDMLAVVPDPATREWVAVTQCQNVVVLAPGKAEPVAGGEAFPLRRVTFLMLPEEAEISLLAARLGGLHVTVRNREDVDVQEERGRATVNTLLSGERTRALETLRSRVLARRGSAATANEPRVATATPPHPMPAPEAPSAPARPDTAPVPALPGRQ